MAGFPAKGALNVWPLDNTRFPNGEGPSPLSPGACAFICCLSKLAGGVGGGDVRRWPCLPQPSPKRGQTLPSAALIRLRQFLERAALSSRECDAQCVLLFVTYLFLKDIGGHV